MHGNCINNENRWFAVAHSHRCCREFIGGEMDVLPRTRTQSLLANAAEKASCRAVVENIGWGNGLEIEIDAKRMALIGADIVVPIEKSEFFL